MLGKPEVEADVEFLFEEIGATLGIAKIFGDIAARLNLKSNCSALEGRAQALNALAMRMIETFGDANDRSEAAGQTLIIATQGGIRRMVTRRFRFSIVVANHGTHDVAVASVEARDVAIQGEIFAVFVVPAMADTVPHIVE